VPIQGEGENDTIDQRSFVEYEVTNMRVGPHWQDVRQVCPIVVVGGLQQLGPDEADGMGFEVERITKIDVVDVGGFSRIGLQVAVTIAGGLNGRIPSLAYHVTAYGRLHRDIGDEGDFL
jgi:hypothetical protein